MFRGGPCPPLYIRGDRVIWKVLAEHSWNPTTTQSDSFLCTVASSKAIRVVTREVRYIHELSLTLEHSMPISSPAAPGLTESKSVRPQIFGICVSWVSEKRDAHLYTEGILIHPM